MKEIIKEHAGFLKQIWKLSKSELIITYKGAALGPAWAILNPAITIFVYWFAFALGLRTNSDVRGATFFQFLMVGMIPWFFIKASIMNGADCYLKKSAFITKMPFPVSTIPTVVLLADLYVNLALTLIMYILLLIMGVPPSIYNIQILYYVPLMYFCQLFFTWITAMLSAVSKDFYSAVKAFITAFFWMSGIVFDPYSMADPILRNIVLASPISYICNGFRNTFLYQTWFFETPYETLIFFAWLIVLAFLGSRFYKKLRRTLPDILA